MIFTPLIGLVLAALAPSAYSQDIQYDSTHNATSIVGTWSSGSQAVKTGPGFANPANMSFTYPKTTGISYSFSDDGFYEIARYRFNGNGSSPTCITGVIGWVHGTYELLGNGSIIMTPLGDGFQQVQDPCAAVSNFLEPYNITETYLQWRIFLDASAGYKLHLFQFDGAPLAPQFHVSPTPTMLPTQKLRNDSSAPAPEQTGNGVKTRNALKTNDVGSRQPWTTAIVGGAGAVAMGIASLLL
ncbi:chaperone for protein-folding within the ER, fungal-domain-containing protein [Collybia nuda]|uniref:Protein ROT1 n=1 Tax=Collybia nuda TaxID=64659 RepID=A0A9P5Y7M5_9AGAR|nr:chaperone for protein-folding within the ER, fungal-domain-containing protein [Collybia nuda]